MKSQILGFNNGGFNWHSTVNGLSVVENVETSFNMLLLGESRNFSIAQEWFLISRINMSILPSSEMLQHGNTLSIFAVFRIFYRKISTANPINWLFPGGCNT